MFHFRINKVVGFYISERLVKNELKFRKSVIFKDLRRKYFPEYTSAGKLGLNFPKQLPNSSKSIKRPLFVMSQEILTSFLYPLKTSEVF